MAQVGPEAIQAIIFATATQEAVLPQAACTLQRKLGATNAFAFDISAACTGFIYALSVADSMIRAQGLSNVLVVGAETLSRVTDYRDRETCILFGDAAGAVLLGNRGQGGPQLHSHLASIGTLGDLLTLKNNRPTDPFWRQGSYEASYLQMKGREVFKHAVKGLVESSQVVMGKAGLTPSEINWFIPHQANQRIMSAVADNLGFKDHQIASTIQTTGNTSSASIPLALSQYYKQGKIHRGNKILMAAFGAGITHGAALLEF